MNGILHRHLFFSTILSRHNILMVIGGLLCVYFSYHLIHGNRSVTRLVSVQNQIESQSMLHQELSMERARIEEKVRMMRPGSLDRDLLEERIQVVLGYSSADDLIIPVQ